MQTTDARAAEALYREALQIFQRTPSINPHDQLPHYAAALLAAKLGDWTEATRHADLGGRMPGSVKGEEWERLKDAIAARNASLLKM